MLREMLSDVLDVINAQVAQQTIVSLVDIVLTRQLRAIQFYRSDAAARLLRMTTAALRKNIERERFPAYKEGTTYWVPVTFVSKYRAERMHLTDEDIGLPLDKIAACQKRLVRYEAQARADLAAKRRSL